MKYVSLVLLVFFTSAQVLCMRYAKTLPGDSYDSSTAVLLGEVMKLIMSFFLLSLEKKSISGAVSQIKNEVTYHSRNVLLQAVPAILYTIQNNFLYLAISNLEAAVFQVSSQLKLLTAAIFSVTFLKKYISPFQWLSLIILGAGVVLVQFDPSAVTPKNSNNNTFVGLVSVVIACTTSGFAGVFMEKMFKDSKFSLWSRNIWLALYSIIAGVLGLLFKNPSLLIPSNFFHGYSFWAFLAVALLAIGGLVIAMVLKYADNILKAFGNSASILVSSWIAVYLFDFKITTQFLIGCSLVMAAIVLYSYGSRNVIYSRIETPKVYSVCSDHLFFFCFLLTRHLDPSSQKLRFYYE